MPQHSFHGDSVQRNAGGSGVGTNTTNGVYRQFHSAQRMTTATSTTPSFFSLTCKQTPPSLSPPPSLLPQPSILTKLPSPSVPSVFPNPPFFSSLLLTSISRVALQCLHSPPDWMGALHPRHCNAFVTNFAIADWLERRTVFFNVWLPAGGGREEEGRADRGGGRGKRRGG